MAAGAPLELGQDRRWGRIRARGVVIRHGKTMLFR
jgi:hypothetical protein